MGNFADASLPTQDVAADASVRSPQRGFALMAFLALLTLAGLSLFIRQINTMQSQSVRTQKSFNALAQAKQALIAWSVLQGDVGSDTYHRPGTLPCPDRTFIGQANSGNAAGSCSSGGGTSLGRLPWKTLGIEMLRDANSEPLWYAVSDNFRNPNMHKASINSDAKGTLLLYAADGTTLMTPPGEELVAIVFSPNAPLAGQDRITFPDAASNFLDSGNGRNNTLASGPFISGPATDKSNNVTDTSNNVIVNDFALGISAAELLAAIEKRALNEAQKALSAFALANNNKLPNPAKSNDIICQTPINDVKTSSNDVPPPPLCKSDNSVCFGRLPEDALSPYMTKIPWFNQNGWGRVLIYAVNKNSALDGSAAECPASLVVDGESKAYVLIAPGSAKAGQKRPSVSLADYLENAENSDTWTSMSSGQATFSAQKSGANDQLRSRP